MSSEIGKKMGFEVTDLWCPGNIMIKVRMLFFDVFFLPSLPFVFLNPTLDSVRRIFLSFYFLAFSSSYFAPALPNPEFSVEHMVRTLSVAWDDSKLQM